MESFIDNYGGKSNIKTLGEPKVTTSKKWAKFFLYRDQTNVDEIASIIYFGGFVNLARWINALFEKTCYSKLTLTYFIVDILDRWNCDQCGKSYLQKNSLRRHQLHECGKQPRYFCPCCNYWAARREHLKMHLKTKKHILLFQRTNELRSKYMPEEDSGNETTSDVRVFHKYWSGFVL